MLLCIVSMHSCRQVASYNYSNWDAVNVWNYCILPYYRFFHEYAQHIASFFFFYLSQFVINLLLRQCVVPHRSLIITHLCEEFVA